MHAFTRNVREIIYAARMTKNTTYMENGNISENTKNSTRGTARKARVRKAVLKVCAWALGIWIGILCVLQIVLSPSVMTGIVEKYANEYVSADLSFRNIGISMFRAFPNVELRMNSCTVTYPHERFDSLITRDMPVQFMGRGKIDTLTGLAGCDTLAVFDRLDVKINPFGLLAWKLDVPMVELVKPRIFAHTFSDGSSNWDVMTGEEESGQAAGGEDSATAEASDGSTGDSGLADESDGNGGDSALPRIAFGEVRMSGRPTIVYSNAADTLSAFITLKDMAFAGRLRSDFRRVGKIELEIDSLFAAGRMGRDTVLAGVDRLHIEGRNGRHVRLDLDSRAYLGTRDFGRIEIPVSLRGHLDLVRDTVPAFDFKRLDGSVAYIPFALSGKVRMPQDSLYVKAEMSFEDIDVAKLVEKYGGIVSADAEMVRTDARFSARLGAEGHYVYDGSRLPGIYGEFSVPKANVSVEGTGISAQVGLAGEIGVDERDRYCLNLSDICLCALGTTQLSGSLGVIDLLGDDILLRPDISFSSRLEEIAAVLPDSLGMSASGIVEGRAKGSVRMSQLDLYRLPEANLDVDLAAQNLRFISPADSVDLYLDSLDFCLVTRRAKADEGLSRKSRVLELNASIDTVSAAYGRKLAFHGRGMRLSMTNDAGILNRTDSTVFYPMKGQFSGMRLLLRDGAETSFGLHGTENSFRITHEGGGRSRIPVLSFRSSNRRMSARSTEGRVFASDVNLNATARMRTSERAARRERRLDSLARIYPEVPRDSLMSVARRERMAALASGNVPEWLREKDFLKQDIDFRLDGTLRRYFLDWGLSGALSLGKARVVTAMLPLRNTVSDVALDFNNNEIHLKSFCLTSGKSDVDVTGGITGLRRAMLGRGPVKADMKIKAEKLDCNEILAAYAAGQKVAGTVSGSSELSDSQYLASAVTQMQTEETDSTVGGLIVIPANVIADVAVEGYDISYANMTIDWLNCNVRVKERCVQIYNTLAAANMGNLFFEGFYATRSKTNIKAGFNLSLIDLTASEVFSMVPQIKEIVPMLSSFDGLLTCELAGTAALDTNMNFIMPTVNGVMRIGGKDLTLAQDEDLRKITRLLKFKNKGDLKINSMSVEGQIGGNRLEVFPFIVDVDRYELAMSGIQNLDMSFRYHVSVIKSPLVFKFGVDLYGQDFDHMRFRIGKAKYKSANSIPVFTKTIDESKMSFSNAIRNVFETGVEKAVAAGEAQEAIRRQKERIGYVSAVDEAVVPLTEEEQKELEGSTAQ